MKKYEILNDFNGRKEQKLFAKGNVVQFSDARAKEIMDYSPNLIKEVVEKPARKTRAKKVTEEKAKDGE